MVDTGSAANVLFKDTFDLIGILPKRIEAWEIPLIDFTERCISSIEVILLPININGTTWNMEFLVVDAPLSYNSIMGWSSLNKLKATVSTYSLESRNMNDG